MEPFLGQICLFAFPFAPKDWAFCQGQLLPVSQYTALYSLIGTTYGGDGSTTFGLPNLQGRVVVCSGNGASNYTLGQMGGEESVTLTTLQMPAHNHMLTGLSGEATVNSPAGNMLASSNGTLEDGGTVAVNTYGPASENTATLDPNSISNAGGNQPTPLMQPYLVLNYCIALQGYFPSRP